MKKKTKIALTATLVAITSLIITAHHSEPPTPTVSPQIAPVSDVAEACMTTTPPTETEPIVAEKIAETGTRKEEITAPSNQQEDVANAEETPQPQRTEKEESTNTPITTSQTTTKPITPTQTAENTPKNGDARIINGQQQGYLINFGWVDYMGGNTAIHVDDMYENGNKIGIMGDINKIVGSMD